jgi:ADP-heptose:LPS heptosyltransferase
VQKEVTDEEIRQLSTYNVDRPLIQSFADTVKILEACEQVISIDGCVAHLSASMGIPTKILLSYNASWTWLIDREDSPWYPSAKLFRQKKINLWDDPIQKIKCELEEGGTHL